MKKAGGKDTELEGLETLYSIWRTIYIVTYENTEKR